MKLHNDHSGMYNNTSNRTQNTGKRKHEKLNVQQMSLTIYFYILFANKPLLTRAEETYNLRYVIFVKIGK